MINYKMNTDNTYTSTIDGLFLSISREEIIGSINHFIKNREGIFVLTGEKGCGKSLFARNISSYIGNITSILINEVHATEDSLLRNVCQELDVEMADSYIFELLLDRLNMKLIEYYKEEKSILLVVDNLYELNDSVIDAILKIGELEYNGNKLIQIMLVSDYDGIRLLREKEREYVNILFKLVLDMKPLNIQECKLFIVKLFRDNGLLTDAIADSDVELIFNLTSGNPGQISSLIEHIFLASPSKEIPDKTRIIAAAEVLGYNIGFIDNKKNVSSKTGLFVSIVMICIVLSAVFVLKLVNDDKQKIVIIDNLTEVLVIDNDSIKDNNISVVSKKDLSTKDNVTNNKIVTIENTLSDNTSKATVITEKVTLNKVEDNITTKDVSKVDNISESTTDNVTDLLPNEKVVLGKCVKLKKNLNFRVYPDLKADRIKVLAAETSYKIISETESWVKISLNDTSGWVYKSMNFLEIFDCE